VADIAAGKVTDVVEEAEEPSAAEPEAVPAEEIISKAPAEDAANVAEEADEP
jgi:hypothetical protein